MSQGNILVVEDDPTTAQRLTRGLEKAGYEVIVANNGAEGLYRFCSETKFLAVVTDILMPEVSGFDLLRTVETLYCTGIMKSVPPIIVCTAVEKYSELKEIIEYEVVYAVTHKPTDVGYLAELIHVASTPPKPEKASRKKNESFETPPG